MIKLLFQRSVAGQPRHGPGNFRVRVVVVIPSCPPNPIIGINDVIAFRAFRMAVGEKNICTEVMPIARTLVVLCGILHIADLRVNIGIKIK